MLGLVILKQNVYCLNIEKQNIFKKNKDKALEC